MPKRTSGYHSWLLDQLTDPRNATSYLNAALGDSSEMLLIALRNIVEAYRMSEAALDSPALDSPWYSMN